VISRACHCSFESAGCTVLVPWAVQNTRRVAGTLVHARRGDVPIAVELGRADVAGMNVTRAS